MIEGDNLEGEVAPLQVTRSVTQVHFMKFPVSVKELFIR